ncbi:MAG: DUF4352 domain-containing protein [Candidatus Eremiobacteraeota bacterium]|nr:DUF4352 domain-containing protein [Candidatus Eremiobacteraeota bacterium]
MRGKQALLILLIYVVSLIISPCLFAQGLTKIYVNGVKLNVYPHIKDGVAYLPANSLAGALGITISWNAKTRICKVNNKVIATSPLIENGILLLPVESISSGAGASVEWDGTAKVIRVSSLAGVSSVAAKKDQSSLPRVTPIKKQASPTVKPTYQPRLTAPKPSVSYQPSAKSGKSKSNSGSISHKPPGSYSGQPSKSAYPNTNRKSSVHIRPSNAPPTMPSNLSLPPMYTTGKVSSPQATYSSTSPFIPKSETNGVFRVTVTNMEYVDSIKDYYKPKPGYRFVIVYLSQQNISDEVQIYTGRFSLLDQNNHSYDYMEGLSNFWLVILRPGGINFGYLVFEVPGDTKPMKMVLHGLNKAPLSVGLR